MKRSLIFFFAVLVLGILRQCGAEIQFTGVLWWLAGAVYVYAPFGAILLVIRSFSSRDNWVGVAISLMVMLVPLVLAIVLSIFLSEDRKADIFQVGFFTQCFFGLLWILICGTIDVTRFCRRVVTEDEERAARMKAAAEEIASAKAACA